MTLLNSLFTNLGAGTAATIYAGAILLEKNMRKEARSDVSSFLKRENIIPDHNILLDYISVTFNLMFGEKHLSWKCIRRSITYTFGFFILYSFILFLVHPEIVQNVLIHLASPDASGHPQVIFPNIAIEILIYAIVFITVILLLPTVPDYISL